MLGFVARVAYIGPNCGPNAARLWAGIQLRPAEPSSSRLGLHVGNAVSYVVSWSHLRMRL